MQITKELNCNQAHKSVMNVIIVFFFLKYIYCQFVVSTVKHAQVDNKNVVFSPCHCNLNASTLPTQRPNYKQYADFAVLLDYKELSRKERLYTRMKGR